LIRIIGIQSEIAGQLRYPNTNQKRLDALHLILTEATKDLTSSDHKRIFAAGCKAVGQSSKIMREWKERWGE